MKDSLLSHIAGKFISEYENVANSSIAYLLNKYSTARKVLKKISNLENIPNYYITELATKLNGRPDITGIDKNGNKVIIIEGKFWANLTNNQPNNYLKELSLKGKLLFLTPEKRKKSLEIEIKKRTKENNKNIIFYSWNEFISLIEIANNRNYDSYLASDLIQLKELCEKMDKKGLPPLSLSDLDPMIGRISYQFSDLMDECKKILSNWDKVSFKGLNKTSTKYGYGFYFKVFNINCFLSFSSYDWYVKDSHTPIWLYLYDESFQKSKEIFHYLNIYDSKNSYDDKQYSSYGIMLSTGMDKEKIINHVLATIKELLIFIHDKKGDS